MAAVDLDAPEHALCSETIARLQHEANMAKVDAIGHAHSEGHFSVMVDELVAAIKDAEWEGAEDEPVCPWCGNLMPGYEAAQGRPTGHDPECTLRKLGTIPIDDAGPRQGVEQTHGNATKEGNRR